jgi:hypothetical protein
MIIKNVKIMNDKEMHEKEKTGGGGITLRGSKKNCQPVWPAVLIGIVVVLITVILVLVFNF